MRTFHAEEMSHFFNNQLGSLATSMFEVVECALKMMTVFGAFLNPGL